MQDDTNDTGIPTRTIHEAYLNLQQAHQEYRRARDNGADTHHQQGTLQEAVLGFYELVRPHLKHESGLSNYWSGDLPDYAGWGFDSPREAADYVREKGTGVYEIQQHTSVVQLNQQVLADGGSDGPLDALDSFEDWHDYLGLSWDSERIVAVEPGEDSVYIQLLRIAVLPLRELDHWQARLVRERAQGAGFMAGETTVETRREYEPAQKLVTAKRLLVEAADKLGALSDFDASSQRTEITREDINKVDQWHQEQVDN